MSEPSSFWSAYIQPYPHHDGLDTPWLGQSPLDSAMYTGLWCRRDIRHFHSLTKIHCTWFLKKGIEIKKMFKDCNSLQIRTTSCYIINFYIICTLKWYFSFLLLILYSQDYWLSILYKGIHISVSWEIGLEVFFSCALKRQFIILNLCNLWSETSLNK